jgi:hypothetical protein
MRMTLLSVRSARYLALCLIVAGVGVLMQPSFAAQLSATPGERARPDFSGVYYPISPFGNAAPANPGAPATAPAGPPPPPRASAPLQDGSRGRPATLPPLTEEYLARYDVVAKSRTSGSSEYDLAVKCIPMGMPYMMTMVYGMEVMQAKDRITFFSEWNDVLRRVYIDGRQPQQKHLDDPTYIGYSTGHWEGDTLVVKTVAVRPETPLDGSGAPHSDAMTIEEHIRLTEPTLLEDRIVVTDPKALTKPWEIVRKYRKASPPNDELRENACAEGLQNVK